MKKILSLILAILGVGLLISFVGKIDLDKPVNNDNNHTTTDNQTTDDNSNTNEPIIDDPISYNHSLFLWYNGGLSFENGHKGFSCYFNITNNSESSVDRISLIDYFINHSSIIDATGTIEISSGNEDISRFKYEDDNFYIGISLNRWYLIDSFSISDTVTLSE